MSQIHELTMIELAAAIRSGELSPVTVTDHYLRRTQELNDQVGAFYTITAEYAADQALAAEKAVTTAEDKAALPPLTGVPIPIKDLNMVAGVRQTLGSKAFETNVPDTDDYVVVAIKQAGAVITGKTATPEFGLPCYTETAVGPPARTPWDLSRSAGGSSGGAAAAVAAGVFIAAYAGVIGPVAERTGYFAALMFMIGIGLAVWSSRWRFVAGAAFVGLTDLSPVGRDADPARWDSTAVGFALGTLVVMLLLRRSVDDRDTRARLAERERDVAAREAVVEERARIARELHDAVAHSVSMMVIQAGAERRVIEDGSTRLSRTGTRLPVTGTSARSQPGWGKLQDVNGG